MPSRKAFRHVAAIDGVELPKAGKPLLEPRLWGRWKSDRRKTFEHVILPKATPEGLRKFRSLFGKFVVTWDKTTCSTFFDCNRFMGFPNDRTPMVQSYTVLARESDRVVICLGEILSPPALKQQNPSLHRLEVIEFDEKGYRISAGLFLEYFRRVD